MQWLLDSELNLTRGLVASLICGIVYAAMIWFVVRRAQRHEKEGSHE